MSFTIALSVDHTTAHKVEGILKSIPENHEKLCRYAVDYRE